MAEHSESDDIESVAQRHEDQGRKAFIKRAFASSAKKMKDVTYTLHVLMELNSAFSKSE